MTEEEQTGTAGATSAPSADAWREVGQQFKAFGRSLATAFQSAWEDEAQREQVGEMRDGLQSMVNDVGQAIDQALTSPEGQQVRAEAERVAQSAHDAGQQAWREAQPQLVAALDRVSAELQQLAKDFQYRTAPSDTTEE